MTTFGFFTRLLDDVSPGERYKLGAEQIRHAEQLGFASAWVAQHHFDRDDGGLPSPPVFLSHVGALTSQIRLGTAVLCLPMEDPLRTAEDLAVADLLTDGRLEVGVSSGGTPTAFPAFGLDFEDRYHLAGKALQTFRTAWSGNAINDTDSRLYPPAPTLVDRIWQGTMSVPGAERAGAAGDGLMLSRTQGRAADAPRATLAQVQQPMIDAYLAALPAGRTPRILASRTAFVADTHEEAMRYAEAGLRNATTRWPWLFPGIPDEGDASLEELIRATDTHVGSAEAVAASLAADTSLEAVDEVSFQVHYVDAPHPKVLRSLELLATAVAPALGWSAAAGAVR